MTGGQPVQAGTCVLPCSLLLVLPSSLCRTLTMCALAAARAQRRRPALHAALARWLEGREGEDEGLAMAQLLMRGAEGAGGAADELRALAWPGCPPISMLTTWLDFSPWYKPADIGDQLAEAREAQAAAARKGPAAARRLVLCASPGYDSPAVRVAAVRPCAPPPQVPLSREREC